MELVLLSSSVKQRRRKRDRKGEAAREGKNKGGNREEGGESIKSKIFTVQTAMALEEAREANAGKDMPGTHLASKAKWRTRRKVTSVSARTRAAQVCNNSHSHLESIRICQAQC